MITGLWERGQMSDEGRGWSAGRGGYNAIV